MTGWTIADAEAFAREAHEGQTRKDGKPVADHCAVVARMLAEMGRPKHVVAAGWLHDVCEDTETHLGTIRERFGLDVAEIVDAVSRRPRESYTQFIERVCHSGPDAIAVKLADLTHNLSTLHRLGDDAGDLRERYRKAAMQLVRARRTARRRVYVMSYNTSPAAVFTLLDDAWAWVHAQHEPWKHSLDIVELDPQPRLPEVAQ